jgi:hypothetical protein
MAEEPADVDTKTTADWSDPNIPTLYANTTNIIVNDSDVSLSFGYQTISTKPLVRVVLTHSTFAQMIEYWAQRYTFLADVYNGDPPSLSALDSKVVVAAFEKMLSGKQNTDAPTDN